ncbi:hypothetical protein ACIHCQ_18185 [Streptomyces sp. NPDC052236]|uniref:hypothetical protein n=1 Tax=Streptomyces sp. NPDC052236 TaxID=3365686 RepID=UPI0037CF7BC3
MTTSKIVTAQIAASFGQFYERSSDLVGREHSWAHRACGSANKPLPTGRAISFDHA